jgi:hypothetical protein
VRRSQQEVRRNSGRSAEMAKLKPKWMKTDISRDTKIQLWRAMKTNPTYPTWQRWIDAHPEIFEKDEAQLGAPSRDVYKALQDEITEMPIDEVLELPSDIQVWIRELRPDVAQVLKARQDRYRDHWAKLARLAGELALCLEFRSDSVSRPAWLVLHGELVKSRTYPDKPGSCFFDGDSVLLSAENSPLYQCLIEHLGAESPKFREELQQAREITIRWFASEREALWPRVADDELVSKLRKQLYVSSERSTFYGQCPICQGWD